MTEENIQCPFNFVIFSLFIVDKRADKFNYLFFHRRY